MRFSKRAGALLAALACALAQPGKANDACDQLWPSNTAVYEHGPATPEMLAQLRDIGPATPPDRRRKLFTISPDGQWVAFVLHRGFPNENKYCVSLAILSTDREAKLRILDLGHELIRDEPPRYGWAKFPIGTAAPVTPRWDPRGRWIAYLKRMNGSTQIWRVSVNTAAAIPVTQSAVDVDDFRISADGQTIIYSARPGVVENSADIEREGLRGWRVDQRSFPVRGPRPQALDAESQFKAVDIETGAERGATEEGLALFETGRNIPGNSSAYATTSAGWEAWAEPVEKPAFPPLYNLSIRHGRETQKCKVGPCEFDWSTSIWWNDSGTKLRFTRREGWANSLTGIYEWVPGRGRPTRVYLTSDALIECQPIADDLLCLRERSLEPRHFVRLNLSSGREVKLFDPNPEFANLNLGHVERLNWRNSSNVPFYGDLVYPVGYVSGRRYPLVIVQYRTKGFLRGGIGDEVPIQVLAGKGYFVLSADNLTYEAIVGRKESIEQLVAAFNEDFRGRRNILSAIEVAAQTLIDKGLVDPRRIGISGLSDGCTTVQFAAVNSGLFSAGSVSGCGWEPFQDVVLGPKIAQSYHESGWPRLADPDPEFWSKISIIQNARRVKFPLLFQSSDNEYLALIGSHTALKQAKVPSDFYIYPNEDHIKWQPTHRLAVYRRNIAWFDFWLKDLVPHDVEGRREAQRWSEMKDTWESTNKRPDL